MPGAGKYLRVGRYFLALAIIIAALYGLTFWPGQPHTPRLGLDLRGGTTVTLTAVTTGGKAPAPQDLATARQIIERRVNGLGVASAEVVTQGTNNIVISVPGDRGEQAKQLGATARLDLRPVVQGPVSASTATGPGSSSTPSATSASPSAGAGTASATAKATAKATGSASLSPRAPSSTPASPSAASSAGAPPTADRPPGPVTEEEATAALASLDCTKEVIHATPPGPKDYMPACSTDGTTKYVLGPTLIAGTQIDKAAAGFDSQSLQGWLVQLTFKSAGANIWSTYTAANVGNAVAFTLDEQVVGTGHPRRHHGHDRDHWQLHPGDRHGPGQLAELRRATAELQPVPGAHRLRDVGHRAARGRPHRRRHRARAGRRLLPHLLPADGPGHDRQPGDLGCLVYATLVILGRSIGFTLTLAGIAGFIVAIGITADSFVIFFERLKDEIREGRSPRSAVPRAWVRSRRTILSADAVSFLAAAILYLLAVGEVQGFAFTLGLSTRAGSARGLPLHPSAGGLDVAAQGILVATDFRARRGDAVAGRRGGVERGQAVGRPAGQRS